MAELGIKPAGGHTPAVSPRPAAPGHRDHSPRLLILRDIPLLNQTRILTRNKHLLRRLNNAADQSIIAAHLHAHALRGNKSRTITLLLTATLLRLPIPSRQNLTKMPINHLRRLQRIPPSLLRRNISDQKTKRSDRATPFSEVTRKPYWVNVRSKDVGLPFLLCPSEAVAQGVAIFSGLGPGRIHPRLKNLDETIIRQNSELKRHIALPSGPERASPTRASTPASGSTHQRRSRASALTVQHYQLFHVKQSLVTTTAAPMPYPETQPWPRRRKRQTLRPITGPHRPDKPGKWHTLPIRITRLQVKDGTP